MDKKTEALASAFNELLDISAAECAREARRIYERYDSHFDVTTERSIYALGIVHAAIMVLGVQALTSDISVGRSFVATIISISSIGFLAAVMARVAILVGFSAYKNNLLAIMRRNDELSKLDGEQPAEVKANHSILVPMALMKISTGISIIALFLVIIIVSISVWFFV